MRNFGNYKSKIDIIWKIYIKRAKILLYIYAIFFILLFIILSYK